MDRTISISEYNLPIVHHALEERLTEVSRVVELLRVLKDSTYSPIIIDMLPVDLQREIRLHPSEVEAQYQSWVSLRLTLKDLIKEFS